MKKPPVMKILKSILPKNAKEVYLYGMDRNTLVIAPKRRTDWDRKALFLKTIPLNATQIKKDSFGNEEIRFTLPKEVVDFYALKQNDYDTTAGKYNLDYKGALVTLNIWDHNQQYENLRWAIRSLVG